MPQLIEGIPIPYKTIHVAVDHPRFTLNPTGCGQKQVVAGVRSARGGFAAPASPFAAVNCASLPFRPRLGLKLKGGVRRGAHPSLRAVFRPGEGEANASRIQVKLPRSAFLDQAHIRTICTRVQFAAGAGHGSQCPAGSVYGRVTAHTPLLEQPLQGPVILRSSDNNLPDMVMALSGPASLPIQIEAAGRIDSVGGGIRSTFAAIPDAPLTKVVLDMQGGRKGLIVNSRNLCVKSKRNRVKANLTGHNGRRQLTKPVVRAVKCGKKGKRRRAGRSSHRRLMR